MCESGSSGRQRTAIKKNISANLVFKLLFLGVLLNPFSSPAQLQQTGGTAATQSQNAVPGDLDIPITNPSLEDTPKENAAPKGWFPFGQTPDIQPGIGDIKQKASDGNTYAGCLHSSFYDEAIGQELATPLKAGVTYTLDVDLAYPPFYSTGVCSGSFAIYGSNAPGEKAVLLWHTEGFTHRSWKRYTATLAPTQDFKYIIAGPDNDAGCTSSKYTAALFDNFSASIRAQPVIITEVMNSCSGVDNGSAMVRVSGNASAYQYLWTPGNYTTATVKDLAAGTYNVAVTDPAGNVSDHKVVVSITNLMVTNKVTMPTCNDRADAAITLTANGGTAPYAYSMNAQSFQDDTVFSNLSAGTYQLTVRDHSGCATTTSSITIDNPPFLQIDQVSTHPVSCDNNTEPQIAVTMEGGVPPYSFSINGSQWQTASNWYQLKEGNYQVKVEDANHCVVQSDAVVTRDDAHCAVKVPNAFTPNNDGNHDRFKPVTYALINNYRFSIYNRWGQEMFATNDPASGWDGQFQGQLQAGGAYIWVLTYRDTEAQDRKQTGAVMLIRN